MANLVKTSFHRRNLTWVLVTALAVSAIATERSLLRADEPREMAVVAPERFHTALAKFVAYRSNQRPTTLASLEAILKETKGTDDPERLKRWRGMNGAVAYVGCNTGGQPCGLTLLEGFVRALHELPEPTLGDCWAGAINHYHEAEHLGTIVPNPDWYPPSIFFQGMKYMVFGDPALSLLGPSR